MEPVKEMESLQQQKQQQPKRRKRQVISASTATFTELQNLLQEMRPYTLQVLRTPYYRNCKAARNMRRGMRQIRDLCKQVRIETVSLGKKSKAEGTRRQRTRPVKPPAPVGREDTIMSSPVGVEEDMKSLIVESQAGNQDSAMPPSDTPTPEEEDSPPTESPPAVLHHVVELSTPAVLHHVVELSTPPSESHFMTPKSEHQIMV